MRPQRLIIPDSRGQGATLRVSRHPEANKIVLSHWRDGICVASTPVEISEVPALIGVLADALGDAIDTTAPATIEERRTLGVLDAIRSWLRPKLAEITELRLARDSTEVDTSD
ncbi:MAG TPA: hypothetical protein VGG38_20900 [Acidimicrobiales bacterium]|jgi:hypothetical protein